MKMKMKMKIIETINEIKPHRVGVTIRLVSWPYSRNLVKHICEYMDIKFANERESKKHEVFKIKSSQNTETVLKKMIKLVNDEAKQLAKISLVGISEERNKIVERIGRELRELKLKNEDEDDL